ncbi:hypothetical protein [Streptomyces sp.]|uniref:hypothetical protein n=1 Tax=Streptomyces sp. TaxID=1931 RepID=UPI002D7993DF|nr:hypothetical protein [Streptomyces sp.]HET6352815.1 hypothetical protein [Streptomyces sp.]
MLARDFARPCHVVDLHCDAIVAAHMLCAGSESFLVMVDSSGEPHSLIRARDILGHLLSDSLRAEPGLLSLTGPFAEAHVVRALAGKRVGDWLCGHGTALAVVAPKTPLIQVLLLLLRTDSPGVVVAEREEEGTRIHGVISAQLLLGRMERTLLTAPGEPY